MFLLEQMKRNVVRGHPHNTYARRGRGGAKPNVYDCIQEGNEKFQGCVRTQKKIFRTTKSQNFSIFSVQKKLLHCHLLLCIEKCKPALSYK